GRAYAGDQSALASLRTALSTQLRLFAPFLPFVTEEVWSWWREGSVHRAPWPTSDELAAGDAGDELVWQTACTVLGEIRKAKTSAKKSLRVEVARLVVAAPVEQLAAFEAARRDI